MNHKASLASEGEERQSESLVYLGSLEDKLAALQAQLAALEQEQAALLLKLKDCCHNKTFYAAAIRDNVDAILAAVRGNRESLEFLSIQPYKNILSHPL